jgi:hypothetical protein
MSKINKRDIDNNDEKIKKNANKTKSKSKIKKDKTPQIFMGLTLSSLVMVMVVVGHFFMLQNQDNKVIDKGTVIMGIIYLE